jgi:hypothetical protein
MSIASLNPEPQAIVPFRANGIRYTARRNDLDDAIAAIELALEYVGNLGDFDVSSLGYSRSARSRARFPRLRLNRLPSTAPKCVAGGSTPH